MKIERRQLLRCVGIGATSIALAGCLTTSDDDDDESSEDSSDTSGSSETGSTGGSSVNEGEIDDSDDSPNGDGSETDDSTDSNDDSDSTGDDENGDSDGESDGDDEEDASEQQEEQERYTIEVTDIVTADRMDVRFESGREERVRLVGVDVPEIFSEPNTGNFEGIPDTEEARECMVEAGEVAKQEAEETLLGETLQFEHDANADKEGDFGRIVGYVYTSQSSTFNYQLVDAGHGRVIDEGFTAYDTFKSAESGAMSDHRGVWACQSDAEPGSDPGTQADDAELTVTAVNPHPDDEPEDLNEEYVTLENEADDDLEFGDWKIENGDGERYVIPDEFTFESGSELTIYTGSGTNSGSELYWNAGESMWEQDGGLLMVLSTQDEIVVSHEY